MIKLKVQNVQNCYSIFKSSIITNLLIIFPFFFKYIKMSKDISAKYYQDKTEKIQKKIEKDIKVLLKKKKAIILL